MTVAFLTHDLHINESNEGLSYVPGGCAFYRCMLPMRAINGNAMGKPAWDANAGFGIKLDDKRAVFGYRTVVLKLLFDVWVPTQIKAAQAIGQRVIVDVDDFYEDIPEDNPAHAETDPSKSRTWNRDHHNEAILAADTITVSTPFLLDHYSALHPDVRLVRNAVLPGMFETKKPTGRKPTIGWVGAVPWKTADLEQAGTWLPLFLDQHDLMFHHSGDIWDRRKFCDVTGVDPARVTTLPMVQINNYHHLFGPIDIGIVPLVDNNFNRAKSNIKGLEYAVNGIPFVASPTPEYRHLASDGIGRIAHDSHEWVTHLTDLLDFSTRRKEAAVQAAAVKERWSMHQRAKEWADVLL